MISGIIKVEVGVIRRSRKLVENLCSGLFRGNDLKYNSLRRRRNLTPVSFVTLIDYS